MTNPILNKVKQHLAAAGAGVKNKAAGSKEVWDNFSPDRKIGLSLGATSLGLGVTNYRNNKANMAHNESRAKLEAKSLAALNKIHKAISTKE